MTDTPAPAAPAKAPEPTVADRLKVAFNRLRNTAGIFNTEAVAELESVMTELDARLSAVEAKVNPPAAPAAPAPAAAS